MTYTELIKKQNKLIENLKEVTIKLESNKIERNDLRKQIIEVREELYKMDKGTRKDSIDCLSGNYPKPSLFKSIRILLTKKYNL